MERVCIYNRCSTEEESQKNALEVQAQESVEIANSFKDWLIIDQFIESQSGTMVKGRDKYQKMIEAIESKRYTIVMIKSIDRLARNTLDWYLFLDCITRNGVKLFIYMDNKFYSPEDSLITGIKAMLAAEFSRELSKKIKNAHRRRQIKQSGLNITNPMFGWDKVENNVYVINEEEAGYLREACDLLENGYGFGKLSREMYNKGVRSKSGKMISSTHWRKLIRSPKMYGTFILHQNEYDFDTKKRNPVPEEEWIYVENALPPIITKEHHERLLKVLDERAEESNITDVNHPKHVGPHELAGKIFCNECGKKFYYRTKTYGGVKEHVWMCSTTVQLGKKSVKNPDGCHTITIVDSDLKNLIAQAYNEKFGVSDNNSSIIDETLRIMRKTLVGKDNTAKMEKLRKDIDKIQKNKSKAFEKLMDGTVSDDDYKMYTDRYNKQLEKLSADLMKLESEMQGIIDYEKRLLDIKKELSETNIIDEAAKEDIIKKVEKITLYKDCTLEIQFNKYKTLGVNISKKDSMTAIDDLYKSKVTYDFKYSPTAKHRKAKDKVNDFIETHDKFTVDEMASCLEISVSTAYLRCRELKEAGKINFKRIPLTGGFWYKEGAVNIDEIVSEDAQKIEAFIKNKGKASIGEVMEAFGLSRDGAKYRLRELKDHNRIIYVHTETVGCWYPPDENGEFSFPITNKQRVIEYLVINKFENIYKIMEDLNISYDVLRAILKELKDEGLVEYDKKKKTGGAWIWIGDNNSEDKII